jgi:hypothetical protein
MKLALLLTAILGGGGRDDPGYDTGLWVDAEIWDDTGTWSD